MPQPRDEAEPVTCRQADEPVAGEIAEQRRPRIPQPPEHPGRHRLQPVEELEERSHQQQRHPGAGHRRVGGEQPQDRVRREHEEQGGASHEPAAEGERGPPRPPDAGRVAPADRVPHADRPGRADAQRHHEGRAGDVEDDLMRGQRGRLEATREGGDDREHPELQGHLPRRRQAERDEAAQAAALEAQTRPGGGDPALVAQNRRREEQRQVRARDDGRPGRTVDPEGRQAEMAEDEQPVGRGVDGVRADQGRRDPGRETDRLQIPAESGVEQERQHAPQDDREVGPGEPPNRGVHPPGVEGRGHRCGRERQRRRQHRRETGPVDEPPPAGVEAPPAVGPARPGDRAPAACRCRTPPPRSRGRCPRPPPRLRPARAGPPSRCRRSPSRSIRARPPRSASRGRSSEAARGGAPGAPSPPWPPEPARCARPSFRALGSDSDGPVNRLRGVLRVAGGARRG